MVDALAKRGEEGRSVAAISFGEVPSNLRSGNFRMGKPDWFCQSSLGLTERSAPGELKHPSTQRNRKQSRQKAGNISLVAASEKEGA